MKRGLSITDHVCQACSAKFKSVRMLSAKSTSNPLPRFCDACRRNNSRWGKGYQGVKKK